RYFPLNETDLEYERPDAKIYYDSGLYPGITLEELPQYICDKATAQPHTQQETQTMNTPDYAQLAKSRVVSDDDLGPESDILLEYEWDNQAEHLEWVATADKAEILSWVTAIREAENAAAE